MVGKNRQFSGFGNSCPDLKQISVLTDHTGFDQSSRTQIMYRLCVLQSRGQEIPSELVDLINVQDPIWEEVERFADQIFGDIFSNFKWCESTNLDSFLNLNLGQRSHRALSKKINYPVLLKKIIDQ